MASRRSVEAKRSAGRIAVGLGFLAVCGGGLWLAGPPQRDFLVSQEAYRAERDGLDPIPGTAAKTVERVAVQYANALREGDCDTVIALTYWMQERLARVADEQGPAAARADHAELCEGLLSPDPSDRVLRDEGIEDAAVFRAATAIRPLRTDAGEKNLAASVAGRLWLEVTYPGMESAIRDPDGRPIRRLNVGINVSTDGLVLKSGVVGNMDLDYDSVVHFY